jgi:hypothetical protein
MARRSRLRGMPTICDSLSFTFVAEYSAAGTAADIEASVGCDVLEKATTHNARRQKSPRILDAFWWVCTEFASGYWEASGFSERMDKGDGLMNRYVPERGWRLLRDARLSGHECCRWSGAHPAQAGNQ